ncbi:hypothetical protein [Fuerstiella marisgermanici]|uniref:Uncharacterized protein n=1 Tax=Fuerstiella marisgermanici TaxID=1891926 RepID=A0A1P8WF10_9PLAN|nr:hypothetical protein [Fuerstiella marisgermanici]APZ92629.1 hypothetical protein Fuma_02240 [Fuerstiella marisgermanici]
MASTRANTTNSKSKSAAKYRVDGAELKPPTPHAFTLPNTSEIRRLNRWLQHEDLTLQEFGEKLAQYGGLGRYVVAIANHRGRHRETSIREPVHAAAFLGISGLQKILEPLIEE